jgi:hypothetical protein
VFYLAGLWITSWLLTLDYCGVPMFPSHTLIQVYGGWSNGEMAQESWSFGIRVVGQPNPQLSSPQGYADAIKTPLQNWFALPASHMANNATLKGCKVNNITTAGHYADSTTHGVTYASIAGGGAGSNVLPAVCCLAITLDSGNTSGLARKGRIYVPFGQGVPAAGAYINGTYQGEMLTQAKALLTLLSVASPGDTAPARPVIVSRGPRTGYETVTGAHGSEKLIPQYNDPGTWNLIKTVSVDNKVDVQRRRARQVTGVRVSSAFP